VTLLSDLSLPDAGWYAGKFNAAQFCNCLKPTFLMRLVIYIDTDIAIFHRIDALIAQLDTADLILLPHTISPLPRPEQFWLHPNNADLFNAGLMNAGCFAVNLANTQNFLKTWEQMNFAPGAFYAPTGWQTDQQHLNWALVSDCRTAVFRDTAYNVAYWNLHERSLRWDALDGGLNSWSVDGRPLVCFHFSGFDPTDPLRLSRHDQRYSIYNLPSVAALLEWYAGALFEAEFGKFFAIPYRFDFLPNGIYLSDFLRTVLKKYEAYFEKFDTRDPAGADALCRALMSPLPATGSLLPLIGAEIFDARPDLQSAFVGSHTSPERLWFWLSRHTGEFGAEALIDCFRRVLASDSLVGFGEVMAEKLDLLGFEGQFLGTDRRRAATLLRNGGQEEDAVALLEGRTEWPIFTDVSAILRGYRERDDLHMTFPDLFGADHAAFCEWLERHSGEELGMPASAIATFSEKTSEGCVARIYNYLARRPDLADIAASELLEDNPERLARELIRGAGEGLEYDIDDVEVFLYLHAHERHMMVVIYLELPQFRGLVLDPRIPEQKRELIPDQHRDKSWVVRGCDLHARYFPLAECYLNAEIKSLLRQPPTRTVLDYLRGERHSRSIARLVESGTINARRKLLALYGTDFELTNRDYPSGANMFGYFHADTGIGESTRGLATAVQHHKPVRRIPLYTGHLRNDTQLSDLFHRFDYATDVNISISYPHQREDFFGLLPTPWLAGRRNIIHLAWEQRDWHPHWSKVYDRYDEIWSISEFAAVPFRRLFGERVLVVPNVLNIDEFPACEELCAERFTRSTFRFLFVFDANSSIERKNPEAVLEAFIQTFAGTRDRKAVELYFKVGNLSRPEHASRVARLRRRAAESGLRVVFDGRNLTRPSLLELIGSADCYVSLHRAEGFGYTMAEAMYYAVPIIASGYSGNLEYMSDANSLLVPCVEDFVKEPDGPFQRGSVWGEPNAEAACEYMRQLFSDRDFARDMGLQGRRAVLRQLTPQAVSKRLQHSANLNVSEATPPLLLPRQDAAVETAATA
jgi:glycosyltransferase involved in cell wall biosynthesis